MYGGSADIVEGHAQRDFAGSDTDVPLRRDDCQLHATGEIALGMPFNDVSGPTVHFTFSPTHSSFY